MTFETWQVALAVAGLAVACTGPTAAWLAHMRKDERRLTRIEGKLDEIKALMGADRAERDRLLDDARREHDQIREIALGAHRKVDLLAARLAGSGS